MWHVLAGDAQLLRQVFAHLLEVLSLTLPYQEKTKSGGKTTNIETIVPKAVSHIASTNQCSLLLTQSWYSVYI